MLVRLACVLMPRDAFSRPAGGARVSESCEYVRAQKPITVPGIYFFKIANTSMKKIVRLLLFSRLFCLDYI